MASFVYICFVCVYVCEEAKPFLSLISYIFMYQVCVNPVNYAEILFLLTTLYSSLSLILFPADVLEGVGRWVECFMGAMENVTCKRENIGWWNLKI
jgi:hypothetical protein